MLAEKRLQIRRQQFTEAGCRATDVGLHDYNSTEADLSYAASILWAAGLQPITSGLCPRSEFKLRGHRSEKELGWCETSDVPVSKALRS